MIVYHYPRVDSTNEQALRLAADHPGLPVLVRADAQTAGRGRTGRAWASPPGGAWFSLAWPAHLPPDRYEPVPLLAGLAVALTVESLIPQASVQIKWPNDVLLAGRKVAGILCERRLPAHAAPHSDALVIGIGINANLRPDQLPADVRFPAASLLAAVGHPTDLALLVQQCADHLVVLLTHLERHGLAADLLDQLQQRLAWRGQSITVRRGPDTLAGTLLGLTATGQLRLQTPAGEIQLPAGEVEQCRQQP